MRTKPVLTTSDIDKMMAAARKKAEGIGLNVSIVVVDEGGHILGAIRMGDAPVITIESARLKARTAALLKAPTGAMAQALTSLPGLAMLPDIILLQGGLPIMADGSGVGGIGVAGGAPPQDEEVAQAGIGALT